MTTTDTEPTPVEIAEVLDKARKHLERVGLHKGHLYDGGLADAGRPLDDCPTCTIGAILHAVYGEPRYPVQAGQATDPRALAATRAVEKHLGGYVPEWNDDPERTKAQVVKAFRETAASLRQGVAA